MHWIADRRRENVSQHHSQGIVALYNWSHFAAKQESYKNWLPWPCPPPLLTNVHGVCMGKLHVVFMHHLCCCMACGTDYSHYIQTKCVCLVIICYEVLKGTYAVHGISLYMCTYRWRVHDLMYHQVEM